MMQAADQRDLAKAHRPDAVETADRREPEIARAVSVSPACGGHAAPHVDAAHGVES